MTGGQSHWITGKKEVLNDSGNTDVEGAPRNGELSGSALRCVG